MPCQSCYTTFESFAVTPILKGDMKILTRYLSMLLPNTPFYKKNLYKNKEAEICKKIRTN